MQSSDSDAATGVTTFGTAPSKPAKKKVTSDTKKFLAALYKIMMPPALSVRKIGIDSYNARLQPSLMGGLEAGPKAGVAAEQKTGLEDEINIPYSLVVGWTLLMLGVTLESGAPVPLLVGMAVLLVVRMTIGPEAAWKAGLVAGVATGLVAGLEAGLVAGLDAGVVVGMAAVLLFVVAAGLKPRLENGVAVLVIEMVAGLMVRVVGGLVAGVAVTAAVGVAAGLVAGMAAGLKAGLESGVTTGLEAALNAAWKTGVMVGVVAGLVVGVVAGLKAGVAATAAVGVTAELMVGVAAGLKAGVVAGLVAGVMAGLMVGLAVGLKFGLEAGVTARLKATEAAELVVGMAYVLLVKVTVVLVVGVTAVMIVGVTTGLETEVTTVLAAVLAAGLLAGVWAGLETVLQAARKAGKLRQCEGSRTLPLFLPDQISKTSKATQLADVREEQQEGGAQICRLEADVHRYYDSCTKNPGHEGFIPLNKFNVENLLLGWQGLDSCIRSLTEITVRVTVEYVSDRRPSTEAVCGTPYPGYPYRGQPRIRVGTGWVHSVHMFPDNYNSQCQTCPCQECCKPSAPTRAFGFIAINTAAHIVFDDIEGKHCTCHLFFDRGSTPQTCEGVVALKGMWRVFPDTSTDGCLMIHVTHDMDLAARLEKMVSHHDCLKENYINKCLLSCPPDVAQTEQDSLVVIVSHPHGCSSNISLGVAKGSEVNEAGVTRYMYDTPTCPGSSGGKVFLKWKDWRMWGFEHTHSRRCSQGEQLNYSSHGVGSLPTIRRQEGSEEADSKGNSEGEQELRGPAEVQEWFPETKLQSLYMKCTKNPGHKYFIPMWTFGEDHLPPDCRHLVEPIKALAKITALVSVKQISEDRPQTFPGSNKPYPRTPHRATAWVYKVLRFSGSYGTDMGKCTCKECLNSGVPKTRFADIIIHTAAHVVYNKFEAEHTTCHLFYDEGRSLEDCGSVIELKGMSHVRNDAEKDVCKLWYVTHDPDMIHRVEKAVNEWESARKRVELMDKIKSKSRRENPSACTSDQPLAIIVSHPHGCSKHVSIGRCVSTDDKGNGQTVCTYTTPTCPGCSGAYVFVVGREYQSWDSHMHLGEHESSKETHLSFSN